LGAIITSIALIVGSIFAIREAIHRIIEPSEVLGIWVFIIAVIGVAINGISIIWLRIKQKNQGISERVVSLHLLEDMIGWIGILATGFVLLFVDIPIIDTIMAMIISCYILFKAVKYIIEIFKILLMANPTDLNVDELIQELKSFEGVDDVHDLHIWSLDGSNSIITLHVVTSLCEMQEMELLKTKIKNYLAEISVHCTIEMESPNCACEFSQSVFCID
jgi:cobalt-zinc-cadmium efflux system protein